MPLFYFNLRTRRGLELDEIGLNLGSAEAAYLEAHASVPGITLDMLMEGGLPGACSFEVRDALGQLHWEIPFSEVLDPIRGGPQPNPHAGRGSARRRLH